MDKINVLSFDSKRINFVAADGRAAVEKKTDKREFDNMTAATAHLGNHAIFLSGGTIRVLAAPVIEWREADSCLVTAYRPGLNLENALRTIGQERDSWIRKLKELLTQMRQTGFLWGDCAPRNMIYDSGQMTLWLVDFERSSQFIRGPVAREVFSEFVCNYALEEFSCFLFADEQKTFFRGISGNGRCALCLCREIGSRRKKKLLQEYFGDKVSYSAEEMRRIEKQMVEAATPFFVDGKPFFPMDIIDRICGEGGCDAYLKIIKRLADSDKGNGRYEKLIDLERTFSGLVPFGR